MAKKSLWNRKKLWRAAGFVTAGLLTQAVFLAALPFAALPIGVNRKVTYTGEITEKRPLQGIYEAADFGLPQKDHFFETSDGETVWCAEVPVKDPRGVVIYLTGIGQPSVTYFFGHAEVMYEEGYASFLLEVRSHGQSSGEQIGLAYTEAADVRAVLDYIRTQPGYRDVPVILHGVSMGGSIALNSFGEYKDVDAVIAMSAYSSFEEQIYEQASKRHVPQFLINLQKPTIQKALSHAFGEDRVETMNPIDQIAKAEGRPVFLLAAAHDQGVSADNTRRLARACPGSELWIRNSSDHFVIRDNDFENVAYDREYCRRILAFLDKVCL